MGSNEVIHWGIHAMKRSGFLIGSAGWSSAGMHGLDEAQDVVDRGGRQDTVPEVEDVAGSAGGPVEDTPRRILEVRDGGQQCDGVVTYCG